MAFAGVMLGEQEYRDLLALCDVDKSGTLEFMEFFNIVSRTRS